MVIKTIKDNLFKIKKGAILINTARGGLVDTDALIKALDNQVLSGAGLDVLEKEEGIKEEAELLKKDFRDTNLKTLLENHMLMTRNDVIITPHNAFNSREGIRRILDTTTENIRAFIDGEPINLVKVKK